MLNHRPPRALITTLLAVTTATACANHTPDAGGDTALAHDLATVQLRANDPTYRAPTPGLDTLAGTSASATTIAPESSGSIASAPGEVGSRATAPPAVGGTVALDTAGHTCAVAGRTAQTDCFRAQIAPSSARLDQAYRSLLTALRAQAPPHARTKRRGDPPAARQLQEAQRAWVGLRERECDRRARGRDAALWAPSRAQCYAEFSTARANELDATLARVRGTSR